MHPDHDEFELLARAAGKDRDAVNELVRRYLPAVYGAARRQMGCAHAAEDVTQTVFISLFNKANRIKQGSILVGWLYEATRFACLNARKGLRRRTLHERSAAEAKMNAQSAVEPRESDREMLAALDDALSALKSNDRNVLLLRFFQQLSLREVGSMMGISEEAARKSVSRGLARLRLALSDQGVSVAESSLAAVLATKVLMPLPGTLGSSVVCSALAAPTIGKVAAGSGWLARLFTLKTAATIGALSVAVTGGSAALLLLGDETTAQVVAAAPAEDERAAFEKSYVLHDDDALARIKPPFPAGRAAWYFEQSPESRNSDNGLPSAMRIEWDGTPHLEGVHFSQQADDGIELYGVLTWVLRIPAVEFDIPEKWASRHLAGDWILKKDATSEQYMASVAKILGDETGKKFAVVQKTIERDVVVISGAFNPPAGNLQGQTVQLELPTDGVEMRRSFAGQATLDMFVVDFSRAIGWPMLAEPGVQIPADIFVGWSTTGSKEVGDSEIPPIKREQLQAILDALSTQTGLTLAIEKRELKQWQLENRD